MNAKELLTSKDKFHIELGLNRIAKILEILGNPQDDLKCVHVAGTNGKGSVCAILESILIKEGLKVAKFTSPHLFSYTERITVNRIKISENEFDCLIKKITDIDKKHNLALTEFEILTAAAFEYFKSQNPDIVILEVGLGGRLDSTNIIKTPLVSVIASISLDHTQRLGNTIDEIAYEKAGIIKKDCPCVFLKNNKGYSVLYNLSKEIGAISYPVDETVKIRSIFNDKGNFKKSIAQIENEEFEVNLNGKFQAQNLSLALAAIKHLPFQISLKSIRSGLKDVEWKFRMEYNDSKKLLIDACHNPDGARVLREFLDENFKQKKIKFIYGTLNNKDYKSVLNTLISSKDKLYFYEFDYPNALKFIELDEEFKTIAEEVKNPLLEIEKNDCDLTVVCGSIYMLGKIFF